ncbi:Tn7 transposase TnsA N-terminal domain-containing protein [Undibacterium sp. Dicai25W]|uniref:Tn7 transposase TnsA N-terminal domain-containing protein n=1 Tax=Undibacterium sp. Dicai25W TaxID=3413034 RepID=UPI003BF27B59
MKPSRKVVTRSPHRVVGLIACNWLQKQPIEYESQLEKRFIQKILLTQGVTEVIHQPFQIEYGDALEKNYTPDFLITFQDGTKIVAEVKPEKFIPKFADTFDAAGDILQQRNFKFCVVSELQIDIKDEPESIDLLLRYAKGSFPNSNIEAVKQFISCATTREISIKEICGSTNSSIHLLFHMLGRRILRFSNEIATSTNTLILGNAEGEYDDNVFIPNWLNDTQWTANSRVRKNDHGVGSSIRGSRHSPKLHVGHL